MIGIHPVFCPGHDIRLDQILKEHSGWLIRDMNGKVYPNYNLALPAVREYFKKAVENSGSRCEVYAGIGIVTSHNKINKEIPDQEIRITRKVGAQGVAFFRANH